MNEQDDFLHTEAIAAFAKEHLPAHYRLGTVRLDYGTSSPSLPQSLEIRIEFQNLLDQDIQGTAQDIKAHQSWANPLIEKIRSQWPAEAIRISFAEKAVPDA